MVFMHGIHAKCGLAVLIAGCLVSGCDDAATTTTAAKVDRTGRDRNLELGHMYLDQKRFDEAAKVYELAVNRDSLHAPSHFYQGLALLQLKDFTAAAGAFTRAIRLDSSYVPAYHNLAVAYLEQGKYRQSVDRLEAALAVDPGSVSTYRFLGFLYQQQHELGRAEAALLKAVELDRGDAQSWDSLGKLHRQQGRHTEAAAALQRAIALQPNRAESYKALWNVHLEAQEFEAAEQVLRMAVEIDSNYTEGYRDLADLLAAQGHAAEAGKVSERFEQLLQLEEDVTLFETGLKEVPDDLSARYALAYSYEQLGRTADALQTYAAVLQREPAHMPTLNRMSQLQLRQENLEDAARLAGQLIALKTGQAEEYQAYFTVGYVLASKGKLDQARAAFEMGLRGDGTNAGAYFNLGKIHAEQGKFAAATVACRRALELDSTMMEAHLALGQVLEEGGDPTAAAESYQAFAAGWHGDPAPLKIARAGLARLQGR